MDLDSIAGCRYLVIGDPVEHSLSPEMQNVGFAELGMKCRYGKLQVKEHELPDFAEYAIKHLDGFNVTVPHKTHILSCLSEMSRTAKLAKSVNTVCCRHGALYGDSTDGYGLEQALREAFAVEPPSLNMLFLGAGGMARSTAFHFAVRGARSIFFANRTLKPAVLLQSEIAAAFPHIRTAAVSLTDRTAVMELLRRSQVTVQATSLGLRLDDPSPIPSEWLTCNPRLCCFDAIYRRTRFLREAALLGLPTADGRGMLLHQGARSLEIWTGRTAPLESMRSILERSLEECRG